MQPVKRVSTPAAVHKLQTIRGDKLGVVGTDNSFRVFSIREYKLLGGFKTTVPRNPVTLANADLSSNGAFVSFYEQTEKFQCVYYTKTKKQLYGLKKHQGEVESCAFNPKGTHLVTGGADGKVYLWGMKNGKLAGVLPPHSDYVSTAAFSDNGQWLATGSYDRTINVTNVSSMNQTLALKGHKEAVTHMAFLSKHRLIAADKSGEIVLWRYLQEKVLKRLPKMLAEITAMRLSDDERFLFAVDKTRRVSVYDMRTFEQVVPELLKVKSLCFCVEYFSENKLLVFGLESGDILFFDLEEQERELSYLVGAKKYDKAYEMIEANPLLRYSEAYEMLEQEWEFNIETATTLLQMGKKKEAKALLDPFQTNADKRIFIQNLLKDFAAFEKFKHAVEHRKHPLAYSVVAQNPALEKTKYYRKMEQEWDKTLSRVKEIIGHKNGEEQAHKLFTPFKGIASKAKVMQTIFEEKQVLTLFQKKIAENSYQEAIKLATKFPFLQNFKEYDKLFVIAERMESQAYRFLEEGKYSKVMQLCDSLEAFPDKGETVAQLKEQATVYAQTMELYASKKFAKLYKMLEQYPFLEETDMFKRMERSWQKRVLEGEKYAARAEVEKIISIFEPFFFIEVKVPKVASLLKVAYLNQIENEAAEEKVSPLRLRAALERFIYFFGIDDMVETTVDQIKQRHPKFRFNMDEILQEGDNYTWVKKELPSNIVKG